MLPTLLADGNLPALARLFDVTYRISTTHRDAARLNHHPLIEKARGIVDIEFVVATDDEVPDPIHHVNWYHRAISDARDQGAQIAFLPPDVTWSNSTLGNMGRHMAEGRLGTAMPYIRVITETLLPALDAIPSGKDGILDIAPGDLVRLAMRHMHPLSAAAIAGSRHGRPSLEKLWPVPGEGLLLRHMVRELFSFDPSRLEITHLWYAGQGTQAKDIHLVTDSDEMLFLSLAPLRKDIPLYIQDHDIDSIDMALSSLHPLNDTPLNSHFAAHSVRLHYGAMSSHKWRKAEVLAGATGKKAIVAREAIQVWNALKADGRCEIACKLLSAALHASPMARRWPFEGALEIVVPTDMAFGGRLPIDLLAEGARDRLFDYILAHVRPMSSDSGKKPGPAAAGRIEVGRHVVTLTDQNLASVN